MVLTIQPQPGDLISVTYQLSGGTSCFELNCDAPSPTLFYQVLDNGDVEPGQQQTTITLTLDRDIPTFNNSANLAFLSYSAETFARVRVYPGFSAKPNDN